jgi:phytol kinase
MRTQSLPPVDRTAQAWHSLVVRLPTCEWRRRLLHLAPGLLPLILLNIPHLDPLAWLAKSGILVAILGMTVFALKRRKLFERHGDNAGWEASVISYAVITLAFFLGLPSQPELGMAVTMILAFGDGSATLAGLLARGRKLPWNRAKSWAGLIAFLFCSIPPAMLIYWAEARPGIPLSVAFACVAPAVVAAAIAESLPTRLNDNLRVGVTAGLTILATHGALVGW